MKTKILILLFIGVFGFFYGCTESNLMPDLDDPVQTEQEDSFLKRSEKPSAMLVGKTECLFTFTPPTFWNGTVDFGDDGVYGLTFISHDAPRDYSQASPFFEDFIIYKEGTDWTDPANVVMIGWNKGVVTYANKLPDPVKWQANGKVTEAYGPLEDWVNCTWHVSGLVYYNMEIGLPVKAVGEVRIN